MSIRIRRSPTGSGLQLLDQLALEDLAAGSEWQGLEELDPARVLVPAQPLPGPGDQGVGVQVGTLGRADHDRADLLAVGRRRPRRRPRPGRCPGVRRAPPRPRAGTR